MSEPKNMALGARAESGYSPDAPHGTSPNMITATLILSALVFVILSDTPDHPADSR